MCSTIATRLAVAIAVVTLAGYCYIAPASSLLGSSADVKYFIKDQECDRIMHIEGSVCLAPTRSSSVEHVTSKHVLLA